jgi:hypothetical protein
MNDIQYVIIYSWNERENCSRYYIEAENDEEAINKGLHFVMKETSDYDERLESLSYVLRKITTEHLVLKDW